MTNVALDAARRERVEQRRREVQSRRRRRDRAGRARERRLVPLAIDRRRPVGAADVRRQRHLAERVEPREHRSADVEPHAPPSVAEVREPLAAAACANSDALADARRRRARAPPMTPSPTGSHSSSSRRPPLGRRPRDARRDDARVVQDEQVARRGASAGRSRDARVRERGRRRRTSSRAALRSAAGSCAISSGRQLVDEVADLHAAGVVLARRAPATDGAGPSAPGRSSSSCSRSRSRRASGGSAAGA